MLVLALAFIRKERVFYNSSALVAKGLVIDLMTGFRADCGWMTGYPETIRFFGHAPTKSGWGKFGTATPVPPLVGFFFIGEFGGQDGRGR
jgi:hypothetical protein